MQQETSDGVINVRCTWNNSDRSQEHSQPAQIKASKSLQPRQVGKAVARRIGYLTTDFDFLDAGQLGQFFGPWTSVINSRDLTDIAVIDILDRLINESGVNILLGGDKAAGS